MIWTATTSDTFVRPLGDSEFAYYPATKDASKDGLGDMFLHLAFRASRTHLHPERLVIAWAILRNRHPLLASKVVDSGDIPCFVFVPPASVQNALEEANAALSFSHESRHELIYTYMNGPRTLSNNHLSHLVISLSGSDESSLERDYHLLMCAPHFTGDGTSLHQSTHDLLAILSSSASNQELLDSIDLSTPWINRLAPAYESRCPVPPRDHKFARAAAKINFALTKEKEIGGHRFTRKQRAPRDTIFVEHVYDELQTKKILKRCKENGVTINHAITALCGVAWARVVQGSPAKDTKESFKDPFMVYTAGNLRSHLLPPPNAIPNLTYWFPALTYFNLVLPSFPPPSPTHASFWLRARSAKEQTRSVVQSPLFVHHALEKASERADAVRGVPVPDTSKLLGTTTTGTLLPPGPAPSAALLGLSLIGNLDALYDRRAYPGFVLHDVTTASKQKAGGMLLLVHTFAGKLWLQLFYDREGFGDDGEVERFLKEVERGVVEFLIGDE
ncbi:hypothetical protein H0H92_005257 [Tricholoma furcatifolium]|nr:hypothetical protein H0H92_005257 [Tricholoma furcatifolium]